MEVIHSTPGRIRIALPTILGSKARARACEEAVRALPGVRHVHANDLTGNLLVLYTPSAETCTMIQQQCAAWAGRQPVPPHASFCRHSGGPGGHAGMVGFMVDLLPHVLPLVFGSCPRCRLR